MNLLENISRNNSDLKIAEIVGILFLIRNTPDLTNTQLVRLTGLPKEELKRFKQSIHELLLDSSGDRVCFSDKGLELLSLIELKPYTWNLLFYQDGSYLDLKKELHNIRKTHGLLPKREYDQWFATEETSINKVRVMQEKGCVENMRVALLGDDDLLSNTLGLLKVKPSKLTVFDIDPSLLEIIATSLPAGLAETVETVVYDARNPLLNKYYHQYDTVVVDPPYTKSGVTLFLNRAIELLNGPNKYIFFYYGNSFKSPEKTVKVQEIINRMGLLIEDKIDKFSRYYGAESIGSASSLYVLKTTPFTTVIPNSSVTENIYTFDKQKEEKFPFVDHVTLKVHDVPTNLLLSRHALMGALKKFCDKHKLKVVNTVAHEFKGGGATITFVLKNSNLVVHTWPEYNALHIDLITCSPILEKGSITVTIEQLFSTNNIELTIVE